MSNAASNRSINGFEFQIWLEDETAPWVRLQGNGGLWGDGALASLNAAGRRTKSLLARIELSVLNGVRAELRREGAVRVYVDHDDHTKRITPTKVLDVLNIRAI